MEPAAAKLIGMGLAAIGMIGAGIGVGSVWAKDKVQVFAYIGFAVTEFIALLAFVIAILIFVS
jgi:F-type H+-transporting ATPase subunit c